MRKDTDEITSRVYNLLVGNADVIKGFFCGHLHSLFFSRVKTHYIDSLGNTVYTTTPQYNTTPSAYMDNAGFATTITVV